MVRLVRLIERSKNLLNEKMSISQEFLLMLIFELVFNISGVTFFLGTYFIIILFLFLVESTLLRSISSFFNSFKVTGRRGSDSEYFLRSTKVNFYL